MPALLGRCDAQQAARRAASAYRACSCSNWSLESIPDLVFEKSGYDCSYPHGTGCLHSHNQDSVKLAP